MLCYTSTMSVDTQENVITNIAAEHSSKRDSQLLLRNTKKTIARLEDNGLQVERILADAGFSSGENYALLEDLDLDAYIPLHGTYVSHKGKFKYDARRNAFICANGQALKPTYQRKAEGRPTSVYR